MELSVSVMPVAGLKLGAGSACLDAKAPDGAGGTRQEARRPRLSGGLDLACTFMGGRPTVGAEAIRAADGAAAKFAGPGFTSPRIGLEEYATAKLSASCAVTGTTVIHGGVRNLTGSDHMEAPGYAEQPPAAYIGLRTAW